MIRVICPQCGQKVSAPDKMNGRTGKCPKCGARVELHVPVAQEAVRLPSTTDPVTQEEPKVKTQSTGGIGTAAGAPTTSNNNLQAAGGCLVLLAILVFGWFLFRSCSLFGPGSPSVAISAPELLTAYRNNAIAADQQYKGKTIKVVGVVKSISSHPVFSGTSVVILGGRGSSILDVLGVHCYFPGGANDELSRLRPGQVVAVVGRCKGQLMTVDVEDCRLVDQ
jgi:DNA-directed RNA polymerase subunit RPC12/RpoP